jgi:hypothetical protein
VDGSRPRRSGSEDTYLTAPHRRSRRRRPVDGYRSTSGVIEVLLRFPGRRRLLLLDLCPCATGQQEQCQSLHLLSAPIRYSNGLALEPAHHPRRRRRVDVAKGTFGRITDRCGREMQRSALCPASHGSWAQVQERKLPLERGTFDRSLERLSRSQDAPSQARGPASRYNGKQLSAPKISRTPTSVATEPVSMGHGASGTGPISAPPDRAGPLFDRTSP